MHNHQFERTGCQRCSAYGQLAAYLQPLCTDAWARCLCPREGVRTKAGNGVRLNQFRRPLMSAFGRHNRSVPMFPDKCSPAPLL